MNGQYIAQLPIERLDAAVRPLFEASGLAQSTLFGDSVRFHRLLELLRPRAKRLTDFVEQAAPLLADTVEYDPAAVGKHLSSADLVSHLEELAATLRKPPRRSTSHMWKAQCVARQNGRV